MGGTGSRHPLRMAIVTLGLLAASCASDATTAPGPPSPPSVTATAPAAPTTVTTAAPEVEPAPRPTIGAPSLTSAPTAAAQTVAPPPPSSAPAPAGDFVFTTVEIDDVLRSRMEPTSWRPGCPVSLAELRYLRVSYMSYAGTPEIGELVVHRDVVAALGDIFGRMWAAGVGVNSMRLIDDFAGDDDASTAADNTAAFNCRSVTGVPGSWSNHAFGTAIDINPLRNPYIGGDGAIQAPGAERYRDRSLAEVGMFVEGDATVAAFDAHGWDWGGRWTNPIDYQHFSAYGG